MEKNTYTNRKKRKEEEEIGSKVKKKKTETKTKKETSIRVVRCVHFPFWFIFECLIGNM
jgi:hypothetical protein